MEPFALLYRHLLLPAVDWNFSYKTFVSTGCLEALVNSDRGCCDRGFCCRELFKLWTFTLHHLTCSKYYYYYYYSSWEAYLADLSKSSDKLK